MHAILRWQPVSFAVSCLLMRPKERERKESIERTVMKPLKWEECPLAMKNDPGMATKHQRVSRLETL